jgi:hypothetical protein
MIHRSCGFSWLKRALSGFIQCGGRVFVESVTERMRRGEVGFAELNRHDDG